MGLKFESPKAPDAEKDYWIDWSEALQEAETIATSVWTAEPPGLTLSDESFAAGVCTVWVSGGVPGTYKLTNAITTSRGLEDLREIDLEVKVM